MLASPRLRDFCVSATAETIEDAAIYSSFPPVAFGVALKTTLMRVFCKEAAKRSVRRFDRCADQLIFGVCVRLRTFLCGSQRRKDCLTEMSPLTNKGPFKKLHFMACQLCVKTGLFEVGHPWLTYPRERQQNSRVTMPKTIEMLLTPWLSCVSIESVSVCVPS